MLQFHVADGYFGAECVGGVVCEGAVLNSAAIIELRMLLLLQLLFPGGGILVRCGGVGGCEEVGLLRVEEA